MDESDAEVYLPAARADELAVPGTFMFTFADVDPERLGGSDAEAFRRGFLGLGSLGWGTLTTVVEATEADRQWMLDRLTGVFLERFGAPEPAAAREQAEEELAFVDSLCEQPVDTILSLERSVSDEEVEEQFHTHAQPASGWRGQYSLLRIVPEEGDG